MNSKKSPSSFSPLAAAVFTLFPLLCGFLSSRASGDIPSVYASLHQPPLSPPGAVFPVVWTLLYLLKGFGFYLVIREGIKKGADLRPASASYLFQLLLNLLWPIVFFRLGLRFGGTVLAVLLAAAVLQMIREFGSISQRAALLQLPYLLWCLFASYLSAGTAVLNLGWI